MKTVKFEIELEDESFKTYTEDEYAAAVMSASAVYEDPAEYLGHVFMFKTTLPDGSIGWIGIN
jgi:hypothetical protein